MWFLQPDPEQMAQIQDRANAAHTEAFLLGYRILESLNEEQLTFIYNVLCASVRNPEYPHHLIGVIDSFRRYHMNICECSASLPRHKPSDHSDPNFLLTFNDHSESVTQPEARNVPGVSMVSYTDHRGRETTVPVDKACETYNLILTHHPDRADTYVCRGCGTEYVSIEDRALKAPGVDGCSGCQIIAGHGGRAPWDD